MRTQAPRGSRTQTFQLHAPSKWLCQAIQLAQVVQQRSFEVHDGGSMNAPCRAPHNSLQACLCPTAPAENSGAASPLYADTMLMIVIVRSPCRAACAAQPLSCAMRLTQPVSLFHCD